MKEKWEILTNLCLYSSRTFVFSLKSEFFLKVVLKLNALNIYEQLFVIIDRYFKIIDFLGDLLLHVIETESHIFSSSETESYSNRLVTCVYDPFSLLNDTYPIICAENCKISGQGNIISNLQQC